MVDRGALEKRCLTCGTGGSNPSLSAYSCRKRPLGPFLATVIVRRDSKGGAKTSELCEFETWRARGGTT